MSQYHNDFTDELAETTTGLLLMVFVYALYIFVLALPPLFKLAVALTQWLLGWLDENLDGRLSESEALTLLAAGGIWAVVPLPAVLLVVAPMVLGAGLGLGLLALPLLVPGFIFGLACGYKALQEDDLEGQAVEVWDVDDLIDVSHDGYGDLDGWLTEGLVLGEDTSEDWVLN